MGAIDRTQGEQPSRAVGREPLSDVFSPKRDIDLYASEYIPPEEIELPSLFDKKSKANQRRAQEAMDRLLPFSGVPFASIQVIGGSTRELMCFPYKKRVLIFVTTGFLEAIQDDALLRAGIAHELGHFYGNDQSVADREGAAILSRAKLNPDDLVRLLEKLRDLDSGDGDTAFRKVNNVDSDFSVMIQIFFKKHASTSKSSLEERIESLKLFILTECSGYILVK